MSVGGALGKFLGRYVAAPAAVGVGLGAAGYAAYLWADPHQDLENQIDQLQRTQQLEQEVDNLTRHIMSDPRVLQAFGTEAATSDQHLMAAGYAWNYANTIVEGYHQLDLSNEGPNSFFERSRADISRGLAEVNQQFPGVSLTAEQRTALLDSINTNWGVAQQALAGYMANTPQAAPPAQAPVPPGP